MKKFICVIAGAIIFSSAIAQAKDVMSCGSLAPNETKTHKVLLEKGTSIIEVFTSVDSLLTCRFFDSSGNMTLEQKKVRRCRGTAALVNPEEVMVKVTNEDTKLVDYRFHLTTN